MGEEGGGGYPVALARRLLGGGQPAGRAAGAGLRALRRRQHVLQR